MSFGQELKDFVTGARHGYEMSSNRRDKKREHERNLINDEIDNAYKAANTEKVLKGNKWYDKVVESDLASQASTRAAQASAIASQKQAREWQPRMNQSVLDTRAAAIEADQNRFIQSMLYPPAGKTPPPVVEGNEYLGIPDGYDGYAMPEDEDLAVPAYADGGLVEEDEEVALPGVAPVPAARPAEALPITPSADVPVPAAPPTAPPVTSRGKTDDNRGGGFSVAYEAVREGAIYQLAQMGLMDESAVQDPQAAAKMAEYLRGRGAAPKAVIDQAYEIVDPDKSLPEGERTMAALATVYSHYVKRGEPEKAKAAAASIVQHQRNLFQTYSSIAKAAMEGGDIEGGLEAAVRAYAAVPDGNDLKAVKIKDGRYAVEVIDEATGKSTSKQVYSPQEIGGFVMGVNPSSFDEFIMGAAGVRQQGGDTDAVKMPTFTQNNEMRQQMREVWGAMAGETVGDTDELVYKGMDEFNPRDADTMMDIAADVVASPKNRGDTNVSERDAIEAAMTVANTRNFDKISKNGGVELTIDDRTVWMPMASFKRLDNIYKRNEKELGDKAREEEGKRRVDAAAARKEQERRMAISETRRERTSDPVMGIPVPRAPAGAVPAPAPAPATSTMGIPMGIDTAAQNRLDLLEQLMRQ